LSYLRDGEESMEPPELVFDRTLPLITSLKQPSFIWSHIVPPHAPYLPVAPFKYRFGSSDEFSGLKVQEGFGNFYSPKQQAAVDQLRLRYDEFILDTDSRVGDYLGKLKKLGRFDDSIIVITSDHGESFTKNFLQHGGPYLHQPLIHVPLMIHLPGQKEGKRIPFYAGHVDLLPTVMDLLDLPIPKWAEGESLKAAMLEGKPTSLPKFSMNLDQDSRFAPPSKGTVAVMQDGWKLVRYLATGKEELYHLASDPGETADLASSNPEQAKKMRDLIYARFKLAR
jgi:arylsulfatase A-like enzyme